MSIEQDKEVVACKKAIKSMLGVKRGIHEEFDDYKRRVRDSTACVIKAVRNPEAISKVAPLLLEKILVNPKGDGIDHPKGQRFFQLLAMCAKEEVFKTEELTEILYAAGVWPGADSGDVEVFSTLLKRQNFEQDCELDLRRDRVGASCLEPRDKSKPWEFVTKSDQALS
ncbi:MAG: hypothetical protein WC470_02720 [Candidatus Paceibacterota bacterium]